jgi:D-threo-aldose 1-dehydrogenase
MLIDPENKFQLPPVIFGTSCLGNLYQSIPYETKLAIVKECIDNSPEIPMFDSAGKYGAGLALETLGKCLQDLQVKPEEVLISNKLGWYRTALTTPEPTFEKGVWKDITNDAVQKISYKGIMDCFDQGNDLLGNYHSQFASVHDPDEYIATAKNKEEEEKLYNDILDAYRALHELKTKGKVLAIGVGSKEWKLIQRISNDVSLDWVMVANSLTLHDHPRELIEFIAELKKKKVTVINSAVFNGGFLIGSDFYNYKEVDKSHSVGAALYQWRDAFFELCKQFNIQPAEACFNYGFNIPGVKSVALNTSKPENVKKNINMATKKVPNDFWLAMIDKGLLDKI